MIKQPMRSPRPGPFSQISTVRRGAASISQQLRAAVELGVIRGELTSGTRLPSVRRLATRLHVAPGTVARVYQSLIAEGLIESRPRSGYFATDKARRPAATAAASVLELVDETIAAAEQARIAPGELIALVSERVARRAAAPTRVAVVGREEAALEERRESVVAAIADLGAEVISVAIEDLERKGPSPWLADVSWYIVPILEFDLVRRLLGPHGTRMLPMTRVVRADVREFISKQPPHAKFGLIAVREDSVGRLMLGVQALHPLITTPLTAPVSNVPRVRHVLAHADVVVVSTLARRVVNEFGPIPVPWTTFLEVPDDRTIGRLRAAITGLGERLLDNP